MASIVTLNQDSPSVQYLCKKDKRLAKVIRMVGPIIYEPHTDVNANIKVSHLGLKRS